MMADQKSIEQRDDGAEMFREYIPKETMLSPFHLTTFFSLRSSSSFSSNFSCDCLSPFFVSVASLLHSFLDTQDGRQYSSS